VEKDRFRTGHRIIVIPRKNASKSTFAELRDSFLSLARRGGLFPRTTPPAGETPPSGDGTRGPTT
jgi:RNase P protein component